MNGIPVLEILKLGLSGFCFLLAFLGYLLLSREQKKKQPNQNMLNTIIVFLGFAFLLGVLVGIVPVFITSSPSPVPRLDGEYLVDASFHRIDLTRFSEVTAEEITTPKSFVVVERTDILQKNTEREISFSQPMYTTGLRIEHEPVMNSVVTSFVELDSIHGDTKKSYEFTLPIGPKRIGHSEVIRNRFTFVNGFRDPKSEWWHASVKYPTAAMAVLIVFPDTKPCRSISAFRQHGISKKQPIRDNPPIIAVDGKNVYWIGARERPETRIYFEWNW